LPTLSWRPLRTSCWIVGTRVSPSGKPHGARRAVLRHCSSCGGAGAALRVPPPALRPPRSGVSPAPPRTRACPSERWRPRTPGGPAPWSRHHAVARDSLVVTQAQASRLPAARMERQNGCLCVATCSNGLVLCSVPGPAKPGPAPRWPAIRGPARGPVRVHGAGHGSPGHGVPTRSVSGRTCRGRTPPAGRPRRCRRRSGRSRPLRSRASRTSPPSPPRWAPPGCSGSGATPYRPG